MSLTPSTLPPIILHLQMASNRQSQLSRLHTHDLIHSEQFHCVRQPSLNPIPIKTRLPVNHIPNTSVTSHPVVQLYSERYPSWLDYHSLRETFNKHGKVTALFLARKKQNRRWSRYGFVTIQSQSTTSMLVKQLNNLWFGTYKLRVNIRRYQSTTSRTTHQITSRKSPAQHAPVTVTERDSRSYAMVVRTGHRKDFSAANQEICSESNSVVHMPVVTHGPSEEERARLQNCLVGVPPEVLFPEAFQLPLSLQRVDC